MQKIFRVILVLAAILTLYIYIKARSWYALDKEFSSSYRQDKYAQALIIAKRQLQAAEDVPFFNRFYEPPTLNNLARAYQSQEKFAEAEFCYKRALKLAEQRYGKYGFRLINILENMAKFYKELSNEEEAQRLLERAKRIKAMNKQEP